MDVMQSPSAASINVYLVKICSPCRHVNVVHLSLEDGSCLSKGHMGGVGRVEGEGLWEPLGS